MYAGPSVRAAAEQVRAGGLDDRFQPYQYRAARRSGDAFWLRLTPAGPLARVGVPVPIVHKGRHLQVDGHAAGSGPSAPLVTAASCA